MLHSFWATLYCILPASLLCDLVTGATAFSHVWKRIRTAPHWSKSSPWDNSHPDNSPPCDSPLGRLPSRSTTHYGDSSQGQERTCSNGDLPGRELSWWGVVLVGVCPCGELSWWWVVLVGVVLVGNCPGWELSKWGLSWWGEVLEGILSRWGVIRVGIVQWGVVLEPSGEHAIKIKYIAPFWEFSVFHWAMTAPMYVERMAYLNG